MGGGAGSPSGSGPGRATSPAWPGARASSGSSTSVGSGRERLGAPAQPPRDRARPRRRGAAADLLPRGDGGRRRQRVLPHAALPGGAAAGDDRAELAAHRHPADRHRRRRSSTCGGRPRSRESRAGRSRSAAPTSSPTARCSTAWRSRMGRRPRPKVPVPFITPWLSSLWLGLVTPVDTRVARPLVEGLTHSDGRHRPRPAPSRSHLAGAVRRGAAAGAGRGIEVLLGAHPGRGSRPPLPGWAPKPPPEIWTPLTARSRPSLEDWCGPSHHDPSAKLRPLFRTLVEVRGALVGRPGRPAGNRLSSKALNAEPGTRVALCKGL